MKAKILYTDDQGIARFTDYPIECRPINERVSLSEVTSATGVQFRHSPTKIFNPWHCTARESSQWVIVTSGLMRVGLRDDTFHDFSPGDMFLSMDIQDGDKFQNHQGHTSQAVGEIPLETFFVKVPYLECLKILEKMGIKSVP